MLWTLRSVDSESSKVPESVQVGFLVLIRAHKRLCRTLEEIPEDHHEFLNKSHVFDLYGHFSATLFSLFFCMGNRRGSYPLYDQMANSAKDQANAYMLLVEHYLEELPLYADLKTMKELERYIYDPEYREEQRQKAIPLETLLKELEEKNRGEKDE